MDRYGEWLENRGGSRSHVATFWGGALFAFGMAFVRFVWVRGDISPELGWSSHFRYFGS
jgi:hypothetical protein